MAKFSAQVLPRLTFGASWAEFSSEDLIKEESALKLTQIVGVAQFLVAVGLKALSSWWLLISSPSPFLEAAVRPFPSGFLHFQNQQRRTLLGLNLSHALGLSFGVGLAFFKGSHDPVRPTQIKPLFSSQLRLMT